jgi:SAM-dependent methyltransferase
MNMVRQNNGAASCRRYYDEYWAGTSGWKPGDALDDDLVRWLKHVAVPGQMLLDVGCGEGGSYSEYLVESEVRVFGVDVSELAARTARSKGVVANCASLERMLPFSDGAFDTVICFEVFEHLFDPEFAAREIHRVLRPGGKLLASVPNVGSWRSRVELAALGHFNPGGSPVTARQFPWRDPHIRFFNRNSIRAMLEAAGFAVEKQGGLDTQFLYSAPGLRHLVRPRFMRPVDKGFRMLGRTFYGILAGRCVVLARKAVKPV